MEKYNRIRKKSTTLASSLATILPGGSKCLVSYLYGLKFTRFMCKNCTPIVCCGCKKKTGADRCPACRVEVQRVINGSRSSLEKHGSPGGSRSFTPRHSGYCIPYRFPLVHVRQNAFHALIRWHDTSTNESLLNQCLSSGARPLVI